MGAIKDKCIESLDLIKETIEEHYEVELIETEWSTNSVLFFYHDGDGFSVQSIRVSIGFSDVDKYRVGIHMTGKYKDKSEFEWQLADLVSQAMRDGFKDIIIHSEALL